MLPTAVLGVVAGVTLQAHAPAAARVVLLAAALIAPCLLLAHRRVGTVWCLVVVLAALGFSRAASESRSPSSGDLGPAGERWIRGRVTALRSGPGEGDARWARLEIVVDRVDPVGAGPVAGDGIRLAIRDSRVAWELGDVVEGRVAFRGARGFCNGGDDGWARWLRSRGISWTGWRATDASLGPVDGAGASRAPGGVLALRGRVGRAIDAAVAGDAAAVLRALVLGDKSRIDRDLRRLFARTGTAHLLAVSGMHLAIVAGGIFAVLSRGLAWLVAPVGAIGVRAVALVGAVIAAAAYTLATGGAVATRRALFMLVFAGLAVVAHRPASAERALCAAGLALVVVEPAVLGELSFQLSFAAVMGLLVFARRFRGTPLAASLLDGATGWSRARGWIVGGVFASFAASVATAPLIARAFGEVSLIGVLANLLISPVLGVGALGTGLLGASFALVVPAAGRGLLGVAGALVDAGIGLVRIFAAVPFAAVATPVPPVGAVVAWVVAVAAFGIDAPGHRRLVWLACALAVVVASFPVRDRPRFRVSFLDVGQGDAALVVSATGEAWLVDAGGLGGSFDPGERVVVPALARVSVDRLRAIILSHADRDHFGGMRAVAEAVPTRALWWNGLPGAGAFMELLASLERRGVRRRALRSGEVLGDDALVWRALHPSPESGPLSKNDASLVLAARFGATRVLFSGDVEARAERSMWRRGADVSATILKVPHHGSRTSSTRGWVRSVRPSVAVASLGAFNRFGFPAPAVVARYRDAGAEWLTTGEWGEVVIVSDGQLEEVRTCRTS